MTERCEGRYPVPMKRDEPFDVTYRCGLHQGHLGECGSGNQPGSGSVVPSAERAASTPQER